MKKGGGMTPNQSKALLIEVQVEKKTDAIDARFMAGKMTPEEYAAAMRELSAWADRQYQRVN